MQCRDLYKSHGTTEMLQFFMSVKKAQTPKVRTQRASAVEWDDVCMFFTLKEYLQ